MRPSHGSQVCSCKLVVCIVGWLARSRSVIDVGKISLPAREIHRIYSDVVQQRVQRQLWALIIPGGIIPPLADGPSYRDCLKLAS